MPAIYTLFTINGRPTWHLLSYFGSWWDAMDTLREYRILGYSNFRLGFATPAELFNFHSKAKGSQNG